MNSLLSRSLFFYPSTLIKGEPIAFLINSYRERQWASLESLREHQFTRVKSIINYAYNNSPFYKKIFDAQGFDIGDICSLDDIKNIPTISKEDLIFNLDAMSENRNRFLCDSKTTGGSTGQPVKLYKNPLALARERCATARSYEWADIEIGDPQLRFWGVPHSQRGARKAYLTDLIANRKRISAFDLTDQSFLKYYNLAVKFSPRYLYGYVSVIENFARYLLENSLNPLPSVRSVITTSEVLSEGARHTIEKAFGVKVYNEYGCGEVGSIAHECSHGNMHLMADNLYVEVDDNIDNTGEIIVTDLYNTATPLIRYRLGDYATLTKEVCECGRSLPLIQSIHGRAYDILEMPSGRKMHPEAIIYVFEDIQTTTNAFKQFQVVQESKFEITVNIITNNSWSNEVKDEVVRSLKRNIGEDINYRINEVDSIQREKSGKMRLVKSNL